MKTALFYRDSTYIFDILLLILLPTYDNKLTETAFIHRDSIYIIGILLPNKQTKTAFIHRNSILPLIPLPTYDNK